MGIEEAEVRAFASERSMGVTAKRKQRVGSEPGDDGRAAKQAEKVATIQRDDPWRETYQL
jgi:hypothetical protein